MPSKKLREVVPGSSIRVDLCGDEQWQWRSGKPPNMRSTMGEGTHDGGRVTGGWKVGRRWNAQVPGRDKSQEPEQPAQNTGETSRRCPSGVRGCKVSGPGRFHHCLEGSRSFQALMDVSLKRQ